MRLNRGSNSQPPGHGSDTLTTEPLGRGYITLRFNVCVTGVKMFFDSQVNCTIFNVISMGEKEYVH